MHKRELINLTGLGVSILLGINAYVEHAPWHNIMTWIMFVASWILSFYKEKGQ